MAKAFAVELREEAALVRLERPPVNALDEQALEELNQALEHIEAREEVRAVVFYSGLTGIFSTGGDMKYWPKAYPDQPTRSAGPEERFLTGWRGLSFPPWPRSRGKSSGTGCPWPWPATSG